MPPTAARILVVDDSAFFRTAVRNALSEIQGTRLVGMPADGRAAMAMLKTEPVDLVILDIEMPVMNGIDTLIAIRECHPDVSVVMLAASSPDAADQSVRALELGALDFLIKANSNDAARNRAELVRQLTNVVEGWQLLHQHLEGGTQGVARPLQPPTSCPGAFPSEPPSVVKRLQAEFRAVATSRRPAPSRFEILVIGSSAGGPLALGQVIPGLPSNLPIPVVVVQHMPSLFTASFAESLNGRAQLEVAEAEDGMAVEPGRVLIAPGGKHTMVRNEKDALGRTKRVIQLTEDPPENHVRPAVDVLFRSVASCFEGNVLATVLTGMGEDGARGVEALKRKGCYCLTQSAETCAVYGMPKIVDRLGLSDESVPLSKIAGRVTELVAKSRRQDPLRGS